MKNFIQFLCHLNFSVKDFLFESFENLSLFDEIVIQVHK